MKIRLTIFLLFFIALFTQAQQSLIPRPEKCVLGAGTFVLGGSPVVECAETGLHGMADSLQVQLRSLGFSNGQKSGRIECRLQSAVGCDNESYRIEVKEDKVVLEASCRTGLFRASQTFLQMLRAGKGKVRACSIDDAPRYGWRGFMVDESRHFFGKEKILQYLDIMAALKMNVFHWHLTDEPGWRIEIKRYPKLTAEGAVGNWHDAGAPARFYTQDDIREIVAYAQARHIMVVP
ncbi:MAG: beta-N-acetylhexosaminidase, partial [Bacteroidaceae bacterium]|nr:beta-N-acetylhexosaminidase [Bacteroidaceae bacterium]